MTTRYEELEHELDTLDIPALSADTMIDALCACLDIDPVATMRAFQEDPEKADIPDIVRTMIWEVLDSSTQIPHIVRALEIGAEMLKLED